MNEQHQFGIAVLGLVIVCVLQLYAWSNNINGTVFAFTSLIFGAIIGKYFDVRHKIKDSVNNYVITKMRDKEREDNKHGNSQE